jgi:hypothetical protein
MFVRSCLFLARHRLFAIALLSVLTLPAAFWARQASFSSKLSDYYPSRHPHMRLYQEFTEMLKMTNTVIVTVTVREGTIFSADALGKVHRLTVGLLDTKGVNPFEVMSLTHPRLKDIKVRSEGISILPVVEHPEQTPSPEELSRIRNAVYTNLGIRAVYVSPDEKTALIRAGFWDGMAEPRAVLARLHTLANNEHDANTDVAFTGNLVLAAWLIDAAPRFLLLMLASAAIAFFFTSRLFGFLNGALAMLLVNIVGALWGFGLLSACGFTLEPLAVIALFPLCIRGLMVVGQWRSSLVNAYTAVSAPFAQETNREQALTHTAGALGRPLTVALCADGAAAFVLTRSDVPALQALGCLSVGWIVGLLAALWIVLPVWSTFGVTQTSGRAWGQRLVARFSSMLQELFRFPLVAHGGKIAITILGLAAAAQLQAGREMLGTTLFYPSHPFNQALSLVDDKFIGVNQLIVIAHTPNEGAFRNPKALEALEAFQHHMAEDAQFGGSLAVTGLAKSITRMFHEDVPKWELIPDDIDAAGQVIFRIITSAATPSEVERFLSTDFRTTAVTFFYRRYSPDLVERVVNRAQTFIAQQQNGAVQFRLGGGILGVLAAVHAAVERTYWRTAVMLLLLAGIGGLIGGKSLRAAFSLMGGVLLTQGVLLSVVWFGGMDLNMYTLPVVVLCTGVIFIPALVRLTDKSATAGRDASGVATSVTVAVAAAAWLFSPLRLQAEMGGLLICLAAAIIVIPPLLRRPRHAAAAE